MFLIRSGAIAGYQRLVSQLGQNPVELIEAAGFSAAQLRNPNTYVSYSKLAELLEISASACGAPLFGLLLSQRQNSSVLGELALTLTQHPTVGDALASANRHLYLHARGAHLNQVNRGDSVVLELELDISSPRGVDQLIQMSVGQLATFIADLLGPEHSPCPLMLRQLHSSGTVGDSQAKRGMQVEFGASCNGVRIPRKSLARRPRFDETTMRQHFREFVLLLEQRYPDNLRDQVKDIMGQLLPSGECAVERVAATLDVHSRVLQKRLQKEGTNYAALLRETRLDIAKQHLRARTMAITDLALNLGYAEVSVFSRNFKQWTGLSPRAWQKLHQAAPREAVI
jgi:AraC-like DNA-binding protein